MTIKKLPLEVQTFFRTGISLTDISQCVIELVHNALDAESTSIAVRIDLEQFSIQVVDNGNGLNKEELDLIGTRYMTSKISSLKDLKTNSKYYGFRGEALASLREACGILLIISRSKGSEETYSKVFRANKEDHKATISAHKRLCVGTTVVVRDLLYNLPVRKARVQPVVELEDLRHALIGLSIINHKVSFTIRNDITRMVIFQTEEYGDICDALKHHCNIKYDHSLVSVTFDLPPFKVFAYISRETEPSKRFQFIYVNGRLVRNKYMNKLINNKLSKSFYLRNIGKEVINEQDKTKEKAYPVFVISICCPYTEYDITSDPRKLMVEFRNWDIVTRCLEHTIEKFVVTESSLNVLPNNIPELLPMVPHINNNDNNIEENPFKSTVMYGSTVKRVTSESEHFKDITVNLNQNANENKLADNIFEDRNKSTNAIKVHDIVDENNYPENQEKVETSISTNMSCNINNEVVDSSAKTLLRETFKNSLKNVTNHPLTNTLSDEKSEEINWKPLSNKSYNDINFICKKELTEHVITESETDNTPHNQLCSLTQSNLVSSKAYVKNTAIIPGLKKSSDNENQFKVPHKIKNSRKRQLQTEHVMTESEPEEESLVKKCIWANSVSKKRKCTRKSILPIQCQDFFDTTLKSMALATDVLFHDKSLDKTPQQKVQIDFYRSVKGNRKHNSIKFTQRNTVKYLSNDNAFYFKSSEGHQPKINTEKDKFERDKNIKYNMKVNITSDTLTEEMGIKKTCKEKQIERPINFPNNKSRTSLSLRQNWKLFTPIFNKVNYIQKPLPINKFPMKPNELIEFNKAVGFSMKCNTKHQENALNMFINDVSGSINCKSDTKNKFSKDHTRKRPHKLKTHNPLDKPLKETLKVQMKSNHRNKTITSLEISKADRCNYFYAQNIHDQQRRSFNLEESYPTNNKLFCGEYLANDTCHFSNWVKHIDMDKFREKDFSKQITTNCKTIHSSIPYRYFKGFQPEENILCSKNKKHLNLVDTTSFKKSCSRNSKNYNQKFSKVSGNILNNENSFKHLNKSKSKSNVYLEHSITDDTLVDGLSNFIDNNNSNKKEQSLNSEKQVQMFSTNQTANINSQINYETNQINIFCEKVLPTHSKSPKNNMEYTSNNTIEEHMESTTEIVKTNVKEDIDCPSSRICIEGDSEVTSMVNNDKIQYINQDIQSLVASHLDTKNIVTTSNIIEEQSPVAMYSRQESQNRKYHPTIQNWNVETMPNGKIVYINPITGMSSFSTPGVGCKSLYLINNRHWFMPKGTSPLLLFKERLNDVNVKLLTDSEKGIVEDIVLTNNATDLATVKWRDNSQGYMEKVLNVLSEECSNIERHPQLWQLQKPCSFSCESLSSAKVLGQIDNKFIASLLKPNEYTSLFLVLFDQHAVDERIRLESLLTGYKQADGQLIKHSLNPPIEICLSESEKAMLTECLLKIPKLGLDLKVEPIKIVVYGVPLCLYNRAIRENQDETLNNMITAFIKQIIKLAEDFRGIIPSLPTFISNIINSEACRGAIKFGDVLSMEKCKLLISKLALCEVPFQCAHGRPVLTPIMEMEDPSDEAEPINLRKLMNWRNSKKN